MSEDKPSYQMGPFPWKWKIFEQHQNIGISDASGAYSRATIVHNSIRSPWAEKDAELIVNAMNGTWGEEINPNAVLKLRDAAQALINYHKTMPIFDSWTNTGGHWASDDLKEVLTALYAALEKTKII